MLCAGDELVLKEADVYKGQALYHASSGGRTEDSGNVFGGDLPYLVGVESPNEGTGAGNVAEKTISYEDAADAILAEYPNAGITADTLRDNMEILSRFESGRVEALKIGNVQITGQQARSLFGLNSANFTIAFGDSEMTFHTSGYGHGVGIDVYKRQVFVFISLIFAALQPIDKRYYSKLMKFSTTDKENSVLKNRLRFVLVKKYRRRIGIRILRFLAKPLFYHTVVGKELVDDKSQPVIFVCNHGEIYGPVATAVYLPFFYRPWICLLYTSRCV